MYPMEIETFRDMGCVQEVDRAKKTCSLDLHPKQGYVAPFLTTLPPTMGLHKTSKTLEACEINERERATYDDSIRLLREDEYPMLKDY
jgi:hypothetical protein